MAKHEPIGIKEIAQSLGVSIGTVDRALHQRPGINPMTRAKVLMMAQTMGYRPNLAARFLKSRRQLRISVQLPCQIATFFDALRDGIREAAAPFEPAVRVDFRSYPHLGEGDAEVFNDALEQGAQGMIIAPGEPAAMKPLIRKAARRNVPVVCVATDAPGTERLTAVTACPQTNGAIVGELLCRILRSPAKVLVVTGSLATEDHAHKLEGFRSMAQICGGSLEIARIVEAHDDERRAYAETKAALARHPEIRGVYVSTANSLPVLQAIEEAGLSGKIVAITTDLFPGARAVDSLGARAGHYPSASADAGPHGVSGALQIPGGRPMPTPADKSGAAHRHEQQSRPVPGAYGAGGRGGRYPLNCIDRKRRLWSSKNSVNVHRCPLDGNF